MLVHWCLVLHRNITFSRQKISDYPDALCNIRNRGIDMNFWVFWSLVWGRNTRELYHQASTGHRIKPLKRTLDSPARAFLYSPFGSRCSTTWRGASTNTSTKGSDAFWCISPGEGPVYTVWRDEGCDSYGSRVCEQLGNLSGHEDDELIGTWQRQRTSLIRRIFSFLDFSSNPRSLFKPNRTLSPSRR